MFRNMDAPLFTQWGPFQDHEMRDNVGRPTDDSLRFLPVRNPPGGQKKNEKTRKSAGARLIASMATPAQNDTNGFHAFQMSAESQVLVVKQSSFQQGITFHHTSYTRTLP